MSGSRADRRRFRIGLALSGGSLRGAGHLGVLEVLEENGILPDIVAGVSAGAVVAALYARGMPVSSMIERARRLAASTLIDWDVPIWPLIKFLLLYPLSRTGLRPSPRRLLPDGLIRGRRLEAFLRKLFHEYPQPRLPCFLLATDLDEATTVVFGSTPSLEGLSGDHRYISLRPPEWATAVCASCSMPGIFRPVRFRERRLVDGAVRNTLPADLLFAAGAQKVIAVDLHLGELADDRIDSFVDVLDRSLTMMLAGIAALRLSSYPVLRLAPPIPDIGWTAFHRIPECIEAGRQYARSHLPMIQRYLEG